jgi:hypothetical protein
MQFACPSWLAIAHDTESWQRGECFVLFFVGEDGSWIDFAIRDSLADAMAEVALVVPSNSWRKCSVLFEFDAFSGVRRVPRPVP